MTINAGTVVIDDITHSSEDEVSASSHRSNIILSSKSLKRIIVSNRRTSYQPTRKSWPTTSHSAPSPSPSVISASALTGTCQQPIHPSHFFGSFRRRSSMLLSSPFGSDMSLNLIKEDHTTLDGMENRDCGDSSSDSGDSGDVDTSQQSIDGDEDKEETQTDSDQDSKSLTYVDDRNVDVHDGLDTAATAAATTITLTIGTDTGRQIDIMGSSVTTNTTITMNSMSSRNSSADITDHLAPTTQILHHNHAFAHLRVEAVTKPTGRAANAVIRRQACTDGGRVECVQ
eukprot:CAMPEP_0198129454 /NCGR_PEP_ID=MMETSP1442-20131203/51763_1 /TAXON_ID= /ORGANISM="Craspedostauros australis, Strain CCMP3328" /LENGTH=285 /DNA_ID=CAMNT_0043789849 /DNA_START=116 /DNA_END=975 /DNA_ORIENTATION=-